MKKISLTFIIILIVIEILFSLNVFATSGYNAGVVEVNEHRETYLDWEKEHKKIEKLYYESLENWIQKYKTEEVPENERITDYQISGYNGGKIIDGKLKTTIDFSVTPVSENTIWNPNGNMAFFTFDIVDGEYIFESASLYPEKYDEFMEAFEEYEKNKETIVEPTGTLPEESMNLENENQIDKLSDLIFVGSAVVLGIAILFVIVLKMRDKRK